jgi:tetratricopeptide (TPR) repeat protein
VAASVEGQKLELQDLERLGRQAIESGNYGEAKRNFRLALERAENEGVSDTQLVVVLGSLAEALRSIGDYNESERLFDRALGILRSNPANKKDLPVILTDLGRLYQETGRYPLSESFLKKALQLTERDLDP